MTRSNYTTKEMLVANPNSAYTVWCGHIDDYLFKYIDAIKKDQHVMLLVLDTKDDWKKIGEVLEKMKFHFPIALKYQTEKKDTIRSTTQIALLLTSKNFSLNFKHCAWFNQEIGYPTNLWDLTPNVSFETTSKRTHLKEGIEKVPFGHVSFDVFFMLHQLSTPLPILKWTYVGPQNRSVIRYSEEIVPCNICFV